ncbi:hypothetical protein [Saccharicrinis aurantiacus]|uniref:hypothetical protein n=1 Tax=Saccharicrinis aurantiacus TaxID=1849719 RepID=UPI00249005FF|nr:hypothetical protein [Saccharicrinis aurantiacus]
MNFEIREYNPCLKKQWDSLIMESDLPSFMLLRDYLEYHQYKYTELSLMYYKKNKLIAVIPGNTVNNTFYSHQFISYGGIIAKRNCSLFDLEIIYEDLEVYLLKRKITNIQIKLAPFYYYESQSQVQDYILSKKRIDNLSTKIGCFINTSKHIFPKSSIEKRKLNLGLFNIGVSENYSEFWTVLDKNLWEMHQTKPVHNIEEITKLKQLFPSFISLFTINDKIDNSIQSGCILFKERNTLRIPYIATSIEGRKNRATHALYYSIVEYYKNSFGYIDFGNINTEERINRGLLNMKERFGASIYKSSIYTYNTYFN